MCKVLPFSFSVNGGALHGEYACCEMRRDILCHSPVFCANKTYLFYTTTTLDNVQHLETPFCHIKEGINAKIPFIHAMYI